MIRFFIPWEGQTFGEVNRGNNPQKFALHDPGCNPRIALKVGVDGVSLFGGGGQKVTFACAVGWWDLDHLHSFR